MDLVFASFKPHQDTAQPFGIRYRCLIGYPSSKVGSQEWKWLFGRDAGRTQQKTVANYLNRRAEAEGYHDIHCIMNHSWGERSCTVGRIHSWTKQGKYFSCATIPWVLALEWASLLLFAKVPMGMGRFDNDSRHEYTVGADNINTVVTQKILKLVRCRNSEHLI